MSPISHGTMFASSRQGINPTATLQILFLGQNVAGLVHALGTLHDYLADLGRSDIGITVHTVVNDRDTQNSSNVVIASLDIDDKTAVIEYAGAHDVDIIFDSNSIFTKHEKFRNNESFLITSDAIEHVVQMEAYLTGHSVPWNFADPVWHIGWVYKYTHQAGISPVAFDLIRIGQDKQYSSKQMEYVRALANKSMHVEHAREYLYYYLQLKRRAFRADNPNNNFNFELTYHLTNYSVYVCSVMDILARLINDKYALGYGRFQSYSITKSDFIQKLSLQRKTLADIFARKKFQEWAEWMFVRRNHITHESNLYLTPMIMEKDDKLSDEELERLVDAELDWNLYGTQVPDPDLAGMRAFVKQNLELQHNYKEVVTDMMSLERVDRSTGQAQGYIVFPLRTIDDDFKMVNDVLTRAIHNLSKSRH